MICLAEVGQRIGLFIFFFEQENIHWVQTTPLGSRDVILDLTATANRADALSMVGVAQWH